MTYLYSPMIISLSIWNFSTLSMDSKQIDRLMFHTPNDNSYLCADVGEVSLISTMKYNYTTSLPLTVDNTTMHALHVQFDAFRNIANVAPGVFRVSSYIYI